MCFKKHKVKKNTKIKTQCLQILRLCDYIIYFFNIISFMERTVSKTSKLPLLFSITLHFFISWISLFLSRSHCLVKPGYTNSFLEQEESSVWNQGKYKSSYSWIFLHTTESASCRNGSNMSKSAPSPSKQPHAKDARLFWMWIKSV